MRFIWGPGEGDVGGYLNGEVILIYVGSPLSLCRLK